MRLILFLILNIIGFLLNLIPIAFTLICFWVYYISISKQVIFNHSNYFVLSIITIASIITSIRIIKDQIKYIRYIKTEGYDKYKQPNIK